MKLPLYLAFNNPTSVFNCNYDGSYFSLLSEQKSLKISLSCDKLGVIAMTKTNRSHYSSLDKDRNLYNRPPAEISQLF